jgi:hypothetical protein
MKTLITHLSAHRIIALVGIVSTALLGAPSAMTQNEIVPPFVNALKPHPGQLGVVAGQFQMESDRAEKNGGASDVPGRRNQR